MIIDRACRLPIKERYISCLDRFQNTIWAFHFGHQVRRERRFSCHLPGLYQFLCLVDERRAWPTWRVVGRSKLLINKCTQNIIDARQDMMPAAYRQAGARRVRFSEAIEKQQKKQKYIFTRLRGSVSSKISRAYHQRFYDSRVMARASIRRRRAA